MGILLYNIFLSLYVIAVRCYAVVSPKARKWIDGRAGWEQHVKATLKPGEKRIWIHCSSLGEFEQARPLIEALKPAYPHYKIVVTFFSPSGYEACLKNNPADYIFYLPHDSKYNARQFISAIDPSLAMFVKYEFWYYYLAELNRRDIPVVLVSGAFRPGQVFFRWYGGLFRQMLRNFTWFFLQDEQSQTLLNKIGIRDNIVVSGDTRYDRVTAIAQNLKAIPAIELFKGTNHILIGGSTWPEDEAVLRSGFNILPPDWKMILAPHEIGAEHIRKLRELFTGETVLYSELDAENTGIDKRVLIIDNIGMLSRLFSYGDVAFVGGGFRKGGIHNILEPAVFGLPVVFGPVYRKFVEAVKLSSLKYVFPVNDAAEGTAVLQKLVGDPHYRREISNSIKQYMKGQTGATVAIMNRVKAHEWLR